MPGHIGDLLKGVCALLALVACVLLAPGEVLAVGMPARVVTLAVGA